MADSDTALPSPKDNKDQQKKPASFPRLFTAFSLKAFSDNTEGVMSPTSILDSKPFSAFKNPFWSESSTPKTPEPETRHKLDSKGIGLGIVDALKDDYFDTNLSKPVLFGSQLRIQISSVPPFSSPAESPGTPPEFGIKTRNSQLSSFSSGLSHSPVKKSMEFGSQLRIQIPSVPPFSSPAESPGTPPEFGIKTRNSQLSSFSSGLSHSPVKKSMETLNSPRVFTGNLSATEMELSEDYTCVISHGPNPRTTHIFDNCIVESCCGVVGFSSSKKENGFLSERSSYQSEDFLSFCYTCKKNLGQGKDIYMYRGEKAFCSRECRYQEMMLEEEEGIDKLESDDVFGTCS